MRKLLLAAALLPALGAETRYQPNWASIDSRPIPGWYDDAKFGIFVHWGLYSVPAWGPKGKYAEWYWNAMEDRQGPTWQFHVRNYGPAFRYQDFVPWFKAEMFDPDQWADLFERSGARYVVLTAKHHEGFCLWPSAEAPKWNSVDVGPHRDLAGDLAKAVRAKGLKMGYYYSLYEWYNPLYLADVRRYVDQHMLPQLKDLVERYRPSLLFADGEWSHPSETWRSTGFLAWLFNESAARAEVVINDRWGKDTRSRHGGYYTLEYGKVEKGRELAAGRKWEECQGIGSSFGYNRNEDLADYKSADQLIRLLVETVARGGNLLLDIGPTADGRIPVIMQERLAEMGEWLKVNGEAIYGSHPWRQSADGEKIRYTAKDGAVYAIVLGGPGLDVVLSAVNQPAKVQLLGYNGSVGSLVQDGKLRVAVPRVDLRYAWVYKLTGVE